LKEYIAAGVSRQDFFRRVGTAFGTDLLPNNTISSQESAAAAQRGDVLIEAAGPVDSTSAGELQAPHSAPSASVTGEGRQSQVVQDLLAERGVRLEAHKKAQDAKAKAESKAKAERKAKENDRLGALEDDAFEASKKAADRKYAGRLKQLLLRNIRITRYLLQHPHPSFYLRRRS